MISNLLHLLALFGISSASKVILLPAIKSTDILELVSVGCSLVRRGHDVHIWMVESVKEVPPVIKSCGFNIIKYRSKYNQDPYNDPDIEKDAITAYATNTPPKPDKSVSRQCEDIKRNSKLRPRLLKEKYNMAILHATYETTCIYDLVNDLNIPYASLTDELSLVSAFSAEWDPNSDERHTGLWQSLIRIIGRALHRRMRYIQTNMINPVAKGHPALGSTLLLVKRDGLLGTPLPVPPNVIHAGGLLLQPPQDIPSVFVTLSESRPTGLILGVFGTTISRLPWEISGKLIRCLGYVEHTVLFRYSEKPPERVARNINMYGWLPQSDLLAMSTTKLFITHAGINSVYEAIYHGVPMLAFPMDSKQAANAEMLVRRGYGLSLDLRKTNESEILATLQELFKNNSYRENVTRASAILKSRAMLPHDHAGYWVDHVLRHGDTHLKPKLAKLDLTLLDVLSKDLPVFAILVTVVAIFLNSCSRKCVKPNRQNTRPRPKQKTS